MSRLNNSFEEIREHIDSAENIAVSGHISPDGDAVGSCCALATGLAKKNKNVDVLCDDIQ